MQQATRGRWIPWIFVGFFAVVFGVNATMIWVGVSTWTGLTTESPYDRGLTYNRNLASAKLQEELGWRPTLEARMIDGDRGELVLSVQDAEGGPLTDAVVEGELQRPIVEGQDLPLALKPYAPGRYRVQVDLPAVGAWDAHLRITRGDERYVIAQRLVLR